MTERPHFPFLSFPLERIKYLGINLPKETKELYRENYRTLMKEIKDNIMSLMKIFHVPGLEESIL